MSAVEFVTVGAHGSLVMEAICVSSWFYGLVVFAVVLDSFSWV